MHDEPIKLELMVSTADDSIVRSTLNELRGLDVQGPRRVRSADPMSIITIAISAVTLVEKLMDLRERLSKHLQRPRVIVRNARGQTVHLDEATGDTLRELRN